MLPLRKEIYQIVKKDKKYYKNLVLKPMAYDIGMKLLESKYCKIDIREFEDWELDKNDPTVVAYRAIIEVKKILKK